MILLSFACALEFHDSFTPSEQASNLLFIAHGSGDSVDDWPMEMSDAIEDHGLDLETWDIWRYDWEKDAESKLFAAGNATAHGEEILNVVHTTEYEHYHLIAHSVGAFIIHTLEQDLSEQATVHSTYLDPFCGSNVFDWEYGHRRFGEFAQFSEAYINMDDGVPSTDSTLQQSHVFDVTARTPATEEGSERHWWPIYVYMNSVQNEDDWGFALSVEAGHIPHQEQPSLYPKGEITILE